MKRPAQYNDDRSDIAPAVMLSGDVIVRFCEIVENMMEIIETKIFSINDKP